ncbi:FAD-dependent oxidoreductase [Cohnella sp. CFH 77786]|uniref:GMC family oxidoreductase n=1 Tax=Cohnella sp. CFH 77786 TaxID=2662265 RepID=UPI001C60B053|nr:FAD-dependent oxidoreductase [Cohnella sp. CFH 77786]
MANSKDKVTHHADHYRDHRSGNLNHRKYQKEADVCIVGAGAAGGVLAYELSKAGLKVVVIEAGPFWNPQTDFASDELSMTHLGWQDTRIVSGNDPLQLGHNNSGRGVGGGTTHFTGVFLRFHESDFRTQTEDGVGEDWPIAYQDLAPYYDKIEKDIAVSGPKHFPWGSYRGPYPYPEREPLSANAEMFRVGCEKLGIRSVVAPLAINSAPFDGRPPCINRGFCNQGCMPNAKFSTLIHHIPKAIQLGAEVISDSMVTQILTNEDGRVTGVTFVHEGHAYEQKARIVILASYVVETPRLLLHSANARFPDGLANSSGWVGKAIMPHSSNDVYGKFPEEIRLYKGTPVLATTQDFYETNLNRGFARGYTLHAHGSRPVEMAKGISKNAKLWGSELRQAMVDYNFYGRVTLVGEVLPDPANCVKLAEEKDEYGMPLAHVSFSYGSNDKRLIAHAVAKMNEIIEAAGGTPAFVTDDTAHLMGGCRMGNNPDTSVTNSFGQTHDIPNLFIGGASLFVTSGGGNPTNTVMALAARTADYIVEQMKQQAL